MKRFYTLVSTREESEGYAVLLDGRPVKTVSRENLVAPNEALAHLVVQEWAAQGEEIIPDSMPLTQILNTKIDRVGKDRAAMQQAVLKYLDTDLLCYFAEGPEALKVRQEELWRPWLDWFAEVFGEKLQTTTGLQALKQGEGIHRAAQAYVAGLDDDLFTILQLVTALSGSLILALAFVQGRAGAQDVLRAIYTEEDFKDEIYDAGRYGPDPMTETARQGKRLDLEAAEIYVKSVS